MMKNTPGPLAPPDRRLNAHIPEKEQLKNILLVIESFTWTTFTTKNRDNGREATTSIKDPRVRMFANTLGPSSQAKTKWWNNRT